MAYEPVRAVYDALEARGCAPTGPVYKAKAKCPAHEDRSPSLSLSEGADNRALVYCFAGCTANAVVAALGLSWTDLFPDNHPKAGRRAKMPPPPVETGQPIVEVLAALASVGIPVHTTLDSRMYVADRCPGCDERRPGALWISHAAPDEDVGPLREPAERQHCPSCRRPHGRVKLTCFNGCEFSTILGSLERLLTARPKAAV